MSGLGVAVAWWSQQMAVEKCWKEAASASEPEQPEREGLGPSTRCFYLQHIHSGRLGGGGGDRDEGEGDKKKNTSRLQSQVQAPHLEEGGAFSNSYLVFIPYFFIFQLRLLYYSFYFIFYRSY